MRTGLLGLGAFPHHEKRTNVVMAVGHAAAATLPGGVVPPQTWNPWQPASAYLGELAGMLDEYKQDIAPAVPLRPGLLSHPGGFGPQ